MPAKAPAKFAKKTASKATQQSSQRGRMVRILTTQERVADMRAFGQEQGSSKAAALSFLQRAGIVTPTGKLTKPFRAA
ncbi:Uncharacterised protein [Bordetella ansorpii]|uniref:Uncharacterized protein n=1 Tax=Bordetella ansorpii TaxID=288768 RepID=A0A157R2F9_9BORD|nr:hypothetical protein [Bordetella ansorpii]SAI52056.1 Uncharacterised protein [Bordetella ansorpii]